MDVQANLLTYEDYLLMPEIHKPCEIIQGELFMTPSPLPDHQWIVMNILSLLRQFLSARRLGVVLPAPCDVIINRSPLQTRQPDVLFRSADRTGITGRAQLRKKKPTEIIPDLIIEVLSPNDSRREIDAKLKDYQTVGVREGWIVSPEAETVELLRISAETIVTLGLYGVHDRFNSDVLSGLEVQVQDIFA
jgi:Uma2 family endonuclease